MYTWYLVDKAMEYRWSSEMGSIYSARPYIQSRLPCTSRFSLWRVEWSLVCETEHYKDSHFYWSPSSEGWLSVINLKAHSAQWREIDGNHNETSKVTQTISTCFRIVLLQNLPDCSMITTWMFPINSAPTHLQTLRRQERWSQTSCYRL